MSPCIEAPCRIVDCDGLVKARGLCNKHYLRDVRHGSPLAGGPVRLTCDRSRAAALWDRIEPRDDGCWIYTGPRSDLGYGSYHMAGYTWRVHRLVYTLLVGEIPDGLDLDHLCHTTDDTCEGGTACRHRACCNPAHLEPVARAENTRRGIRARRKLCRNGHPYDVEIARRGGTERRCSTCERAKRKARTERELLKRQAASGVPQPGHLRNKETAA